VANQKVVNNIIVVIMVLAAIALVSGCNSLKSFGYEFGDVHRVYCDSTNKEVRAQLKATLTDRGVKVDFNYCKSFGLVDALLIKPVQKNKKVRE
jgi:hypothetical protein